MPIYNVVIYETQRYEVQVEAKDEDAARRWVDYIETDDMVRDTEYYETEVKSVEKAKEKENDTVSKGKDEPGSKNKGI